MHKTGGTFYSPEGLNKSSSCSKSVECECPRDRAREFFLAVMDAGMVCGEMALTVLRLHVTYASQAMESSHVSLMRREDLECLVPERPEVGLQITHLLGKRRPGLRLRRH